MKRRLLGSVLCIIGLCSCTLEPDYKRPALPVVSAWSDAAGVAGASSAAAARVRA